MVNCDSNKMVKLVLVMSLLVAKLSAHIFYGANIFFHSIFKDSRLTNSKKDLFQHTLQQEMGFFDTRTVADIKSSMDPISIIDIIAWQVPYLIADVLKLFIVFYYMMTMNFPLTVLSLSFMVIFRLIIRPIEKVSHL